MMQDVPINLITRNPNQPRQTFPQKELEELAASIKKRGLLQAIVVRNIERDAFRYEIVAGERRFRAHKLIEARTIRAEIVDISDEEMQLRAIVENLQRQDMNPIDEGRAYQTLVGQGYTLTRIASELGLGGTAVVQNRLDLLELDDDVQKLVATGVLPVSMGWAVRLAPRTQQSRMVRDISSGKLRTVEQVRHAAIALRDADRQMDAFGAAAPKASAGDLRTVSHLEAKIESIAAMVLAGFKDGECVAAQRVSPDRVKTMADRLALIRKHILQMEHDLRCVATQTEIKLDLHRERRRAS